MRQQYFWHRFFSHQPDLNFDNPDVHDAIIDAMRFWLDMGIDGFRLDAVPYLYERPGTNGENLPETHEFLSKVRKVVDDEYPGRVLLCEANQWPEDVVDYFGDPEVGGDECHMAFHFPVMPRIFMAVRRESRFPISEILEQTPAIPDSCQWGIFLRNHDELTLEMVTDEDRDYMWGEYAKDPRMKANIGIRRRLAPLLDNDTNQIELFTALLLSLPGSPCLYYGDEIGMGDNIWLGDRDGVRTPMQWTADRNAGFSSATPGQAGPPGDPGPGLRLPVGQRRGPARELLVAAALDPADDPRAPQPPGVRARRASTTSAAPTRRCCPTSASTSATTAGGPDPLRQQPLPLPAAGRARPAPLRGPAAVELLGGVPFPEIGELPYLLTLAGYGFYWFRLTAAGAHRGGPAAVTAPTTEAEPDVFARYLERTRWFGGKGRPFAVTGVRRIGELPGSGDGLLGGDRPGRGHLRRRTRRHRDLPGAAGALHRARDPPRPRLPRLVGGARVRLGPRVRRAPRPRGDGAVAARVRRRRRRDRRQPHRRSQRPGLPPARRATSSTSTPTRRSSRASSRTPRSPSARTR